MNRRAALFSVLACAGGAACNRAEPTSAPPAPVTSASAAASPSPSPSPRAVASADASLATPGVDGDAAPPSRGDATALAACKSAGATVRFGPAAVSSFADMEALASGLGLRAPGEPTKKTPPRACDQDLGNCHRALCPNNAGVSLFWRPAVGYVGDVPLLVVPGPGRLVVIDGERAVSERDSYCRGISCVSEVPQVTVVDPRAMHVRVRFENMVPDRAGCATVIVTEDWVLDPRTLAPQLSVHQERDDDDPAAYAGEPTVEARVEGRFLHLASRDGGKRCDAKISLPALPPADDTRPNP